MEASKDSTRFRGQLDALTDLLAGPDAPLRDRVCATAAVLSVGATYMFYLQQVDDPDKLGAIILELATDLIHLAISLIGEQAERAWPSKLHADDGLITLRQ